ncbi:MAG: sulfurtransferase complex subunit TusD [Pseudomonadales bacterium]|nr:sulfurtransferase complex subunit TusD [Pseudomonadales bacterium]NRA14301.1 sulfurtransferase complex subunit TusD [Oceanospirillaceae bacterium]
MIISLLIYASQNSGQAEQTALRFTRSALAQGHKIHRVFFYGETVSGISSLKVIPRDEIDITGQWLDLAESDDLDLVVCIAAAVRRGVLDQQECDRHNRVAANLVAGFNLSGLGQLADAILSSDRLLTFGN